MAQSVRFQSRGIESCKRGTTELRFFQFKFRSMPTFSDDFSSLVQGFSGVTFQNFIFFRDTKVAKFGTTSIWRALRKYAPFDGVWGIVFL